MPGSPCDSHTSNSPDKVECDHSDSGDDKGSSPGWWTKIPPTNEVSHFENLQSTNWNSLRFKSPPSVDSDIGWRVEFRPLDIQLTDFENAALTVFTGMLVNIINEFSLDFMLPISYVDQNMVLCQDQDALLNQKFWFRVDLFDNQGNDYK